MNTMNLSNVARNGFTKNKIHAIAFGLIALQAVVRGIGTFDSWFYSSDFELLMPNQSLFSHDFGDSSLSPTAAFLGHVFGPNNLNWSQAAFGILVLQLLAGLAAWWMLVTVFGSRHLALIPLIWYLTTPLTLVPSLWWSNALSQWPLQIFVFLAIGFHVAGLRDGYVSRAPLVLLSLAFASIAHPKGWLTVFALVGITIAVTQRGNLSNSLKAVARIWPFWVAAVPLTIFLGWLTNSGNRVLDVAKCEPSHIWDASFTENIVGMSLGGPWSWHVPQTQSNALGSIAFINQKSCTPLLGNDGELLTTAPLLWLAPNIIFLSIAVVAVAVFAVAQFSRFSNAFRSLPWMFVIAIMSIAVTYLGLNPTAGGQLPGSEPSQFTDLAPFIALFLGTVLMGLDSSGKNGLTARPKKLIELSLPNWTFGVFGMVLILGASVSTMSFTFSWAQLGDPEHFPARAAFTFAQAQVAESDGKDLPFNVIEGPMPDGIVHQALFPANLVSNSFAPHLQHVQSVEMGTNLKLLKRSGQFVSASVAAAPLAMQRTEPCGLFVDSNSELVDFSRLGLAGEWVQLNYLGSADDNATIKYGNQVLRVPTRRGLHVMLIKLQTPTRKIEVHTTDRTAICIDSISLGDLNIPIGSVRP